MEILGQEVGEGGLSMVMYEGSCRGRGDVDKRTSRWTLDLRFEEFLKGIRFLVLLGILVGHRDQN